MKDFNYYYDIFNSMLNVYDFALWVDEDNFWRVIDKQGANLGNIEGDKFETLTDIVDRMEIYHNDYIFTNIDEYFPKIKYSNLEDLYKQLSCIVKNNDDLSEFEFDIRVIEMFLYGAEILSNKKDNEEMKMWWRKNNE